MFNYDIRKLFKRVINGSNVPPISYLVTIYQFDKERDEAHLKTWLEVGCRQISDGHFEVKKI